MFLQNILNMNRNRDAQGRFTRAPDNSNENSLIEFENPTGTSSPTTNTQAGNQEQPVQAPPPPATAGASAAATTSTQPTQPTNNSQSHQASATANPTLSPPENEATRANYVVDRLIEILQQPRASNETPVERLEELLQILHITPNHQNPHETAQQVRQQNGNPPPVTQAPGTSQQEQPQAQHALQFHQRQQQASQTRQIAQNVVSMPHQMYFQPVAPQFFQGNGQPGFNASFLQQQIPQQQGVPANQVIGNPFDRVPQAHAPIIRVPPPGIDKEEIDLWFIRLEAWFSHNNIHVDQQRFHILTTLLDSTTLAQVYTEANFPPEHNKYATLQKALKVALEESKTKRYQRLLHGTELGDQRPSHRLNELKRLASNGLTMNESLLKHIWLNHLPSEAQAILAATSDQSLGNLAKLADGVVESLSLKHVSAIRQNSEHEQEPEYVRDLRKSIQKMANEIKSLRKHAKSRDSSEETPRERSRNREKTQNRQRSPTPSARKHYTQCWYHFKFGENARNCESQCEYWPEFQAKN